MSDPALLIQKQADGRFRAVSVRHVDMNGGFIRRLLEHYPTVETVTKLFDKGDVPIVWIPALTHGFKEAEELMPIGKRAEDTSQRYFDTLEDAYAVPVNRFYTFYHDGENWHLIDATEEHNQHALVLLRYKPHPVWHDGST